MSKFDPKLDFIAIRIAVLTVSVRVSPSKRLGLKSRSTATSPSTPESVCELAVCGDTCAGARSGDDVMAEGGSGAGRFLRGGFAGMFDARDDA